MVPSRVIPAQLTKTVFERYWSTFEADYFLRYNIDTLIWHMKTLAPVSALELPIVAVLYAENSGGTEVMVFGPDMTHLLVMTTAGFDRLNLNIVDARLHTTQMGFSLHNYLVLEQNDKASVDIDSTTYNYCCPLAY